MRNFMIGFGNWSRILRHDMVSNGVDGSSHFTSAELDLGYPLIIEGLWTLLHYDEICETFQPRGVHAFFTGVCGCASSAGGRVSIPLRRVWPNGIVLEVSGLESSGLLCGCTWTEH